jgi:hypothetical protein
MSLINRIRPGSRVTILVPNGQRIDHKMGKIVQEWKESTGRAVMRSAEGGWVLDMGGKYGTPGLANAENVVAVNGRRSCGSIGLPFRARHPHGCRLVPFPPDG